MIFNGDWILVLESIWHHVSKCEIFLRSLFRVSRLKIPYLLLKLVIFSSLVLCLTLCPLPLVLSAVRSVFASFFYRTEYPKVLVLKRTFWKWFSTVMWTLWQKSFGTTISNVRINIVSQANSTAKWIQTDVSMSKLTSSQHLVPSSATWQIFSLVLLGPILLMDLESFFSHFLHSSTQLARFLCQRLGITGHNSAQITGYPPTVRKSIQIRSTGQISLHMKCDQLFIKWRRPGAWPRHR